MGKGGGGSSHTPKEQKDTLESSQLISIIDIFSEGPIYGLKDGLKSVYLDNTPVLASDGTENYPSVSVSVNLGTEDQDYLDGFPQNASEISVGVQVKQSAPVIRTVTDDKVDMVRLNLYSSGLYVVTKDGDTKRTDLQMRVEMRGPGSNDWEVKARLDFIDQKSKGEFSFQAEIWDLPPTPFDIRVVRETSDAVDGDWQAIQNLSYWRSYSLVINQKYRWPYTAYAGIKFDSDNFNGAIPSRKYLMRGRIVQVPVNYDPETRTYSGYWNLQFKAAYTNNPAWIIYDMIKNNVYGLGKFGINANEMMLYQAAQFCDTLVDNGRGEMVPRFVCNAYITEQRQAWDLITDFLSIFRAIPAYDGKQFFPVIDMPKDPVYLYNESNTVPDSNGVHFNYSATGLTDRFSVVEVRFINKDNFYEQDTIQVVDDEMVNRFGWNVKKVEAFGTDTKDQAQRFGLYILATEKFESKSVSFTVGQDGLRNLPGDIIEVYDPSYFGANIGGRILNISDDRMTVTLDRKISIPVNAEVILTFISDERVPVDYPVTLGSGDFDTFRLSTTCPSTLGVYSVYGIRINNKGRKLWRCVSISENADSLQYSINAVEYYAEKTAYVDDGVYFAPESETMYGNNIPAVNGLEIEYTPESDRGTVRIYWNAPQTARNISYNVRVLRDGALVVNANTTDAFYFITPDAVGSYSVSVRGVGSDGKMGVESQAVFIMAVPPQPSSISWNSSNYTITLTPVLSQLATLGEQYEWFIGASEDEVLAQNNNLGLAYRLNQVGLMPNTTYWFGVRSVNSLGRSAITTVEAKTKFDADEITGILEIALPKTEYIQGINTDIEGLSDLASLRVIDKNGNNPRITGVYMNAGDASQNIASVVDIVADAFAISSPDDLTRWVYFDSTSRNLVILGDIRAKAGTLDNVTINESCVIKGKLSANNIEGDIYTRQVGILSNKEIHTGTGQVNAVFMKIAAAPDFARVLETNLELSMQCWERNYFYVEMSADGGATWSQLHYFDSGNDGGTEKWPINQITLPESGTTEIQLRVRTTTGRAADIYITSLDNTGTAGTPEYKGTASAYKKGKTIITSVG